jgi:hypothetical protein
MCELFVPEKDSTYKPETNARPLKRELFLAEQDAATRRELSDREENTAFHSEETTYRSSPSTLNPPATRIGTSLQAPDVDPDATNTSNTRRRNRRRGKKRKSIRETAQDPTQSSALANDQAGVLPNGTSADSNNITSNNNFMSAIRPRTSTPLWTLRPTISNNELYKALRPHAHGGLDL